MSDHQASDCPHCGVSIDPPPKRSRKCPHCRQPIVVRRGHLLTEAEADEFDDRLDDAREAIASRKVAERQALFRKSVADELRQAKESGVVAGMQLLMSGDACDVFRSRRGLVFPIDSCTVDDLPPYPDCEVDDGCDSTVVSILTPEYGGPSKPNFCRPPGPTRESVRIVRRAAMEEYDRENTWLSWAYWMVRVMIGK